MRTDSLASFVSIFLQLHFGNVFHHTVKLIVVLPLSQAAVPADAMVMTWLESNIKQVPILLVLDHLVRAILNCNIAMIVLVFVKLVVFRECCIIELMSRLFNLVDIHVPNVLVLIIIVQHPLLAQVTLGKVKGRFIMVSL